MKSLILFLNIIHIAIIFCFFLPLFVSSKRILQIYIACILILFLQWYFLKDCPITILQNHIEKKEEGFLIRKLQTILPKKYYNSLKTYLPYIHDLLVFTMLFYAFYQLNWIPTGILIISTVIIINYLRNGTILFIW